MTAVTQTKSKFSLSVVDLILLAVVVLGLVLGILRLVQGLGATTNLNTGYPWGMWIALDVFTIPFSALAFTLAAVVHIFNQKQYHGLSRLTVLAGFLGYLVVILVLVMDIGRWDQFYSVLMPWRWNLHSFMFEVALSITLYFGVLTLELLTIVFERSGNQVVVWLERLIVLIAAVGVLLSTVHQGSMGAVFVILKHRVNAVWWSPLLPVFFLTSAVFTGFAVAIFVGVLTWKAMGKAAPIKLLATLAKIAGITQVIYLVLKLGDLIVAGELGLALGNVLFLAEVIAGVVVPLIIFLSKARENESGLLIASICTIVGIAVNRLSIAWFTLQPVRPAHIAYTYSPHWMEWTIAVAAVAAAILLYSLAVRYIPVLRETVTGDAH